MPIISSDKKNQIDHPVYNILKDISIDVPIVPVTFLNNYQFNQELFNLEKYVLADFCEYGANDFDRKYTHLWGVNSAQFPKTQKEEWIKFDEFVRSKPPLVYFKRELIKTDKVSQNIYPIDFPCVHQLQPLQTKEQFEKRPIEVFFSWGHSHESRRALHGNIFINATKKGYGVVDNFYHIETAIKEYSRVWVTVQVPHYARIDMANVIFINGQSKLSVSLPGAGGKCFRMAESPLNSVMVMQDDKFKYAYEWIDKVNCIKIQLGDELEEIRGLKNQWQTIETIEESLQNSNLYDIYVSGLENMSHYHLPNYISEYIEPIIKHHL